MTITKSSTRLVALAAGVAVAVALVFATSAPVRAAALGSDQVTAIINLLQSFGADATTIANVRASLTGTAPTTPTTGGSMACNASVWTRDLTVGSTGADVMALQKFLNMSAATQVAATGAGSPGMETSTFGPATKAAVVKFQTANAITPAAGYVGPVTRTAIAAKCGTTPTTPGTPGTPGTPTTPTGLKGGEGQFVNIDNISAEVEDEVSEGGEENVFGVELEAEDSDLSIERVDVDFTLEDADTTESDNLEDYVTEVSLMLDGKVLATLDVDEADVNDAGDGDFTTAADANDVYSFRFTGLNGIVREGDTGKIYIAVKAVGNIDSTDSSADWHVLIPDDGIRAVDAAGISETYVGGSDLDQENFSVVEADAGDIDLAAPQADNEDRILSLNADTTTDNVEIMVFTLESQTSDNNVTEIEIDLATTSATTTLFSSVVKQLKLYKGSTLLATEDVSINATDPSGTVLFDNLDVDIKEDEEVEFTVKADFYDDADEREGFTFKATVDASQIEAEDAEGDDITVTGDVDGADLELRTTGISVAFVSATESNSVGTIAGNADTANLEIVFDVTAVGDDDIYVEGDLATQGIIAAVGVDGLMWATTTNSTSDTGTSTTLTPTLSASGDASSDDTAGTDQDFFIESGETRRFTFRVSIPAGTDNSSIGARITGIKWGTIDADDTMNNLYDFDLDDYKTDTLTGLYIR